MKFAPISRILGIVITILILVLVIFQLFFQVPDYHEKLSFSAYSEYSELFNDSAKEKLVPKVSYICKNRGPVSEFVYDSNYSVIVCKINTSSNLSLKKLVINDIKGTSRSWFSDYATKNIDFYNFSYAVDSVPVIKQVLLTFYGDSVVNSFANDTVAIYCLGMDRIFIRYEKNRGPDIILEKENAFSNRIPMEVMLIKRDTTLYFIFSSPIDNKGTIAKGFSRNLIN